ncbi:hypothetical protein [Pengzhenrongella sicca]|uniref:Uncharacterized protein n=1 Tax=Pengzhenrongella sicca TaxID=2819238 RepID=A0A8A4ZIJ0_9MICO|nr:hypothetical protein [Pengzhenrongella sicca]QTE30326.1 hypothetical protein J4E96_04820 [Pengzhenrongella sicca]
MLTVVLLATVLAGCGGSGAGTTPVDDAIAVPSASGCDPASTNAYNGEIVGAGESATFATQIELDLRPEAIAALTDTVVVVAGRHSDWAAAPGSPAVVARLSQETGEVLASTTLDFETVGAESSGTSATVSQLATGDGRIYALWDALSSDSDSDRLVALDSCTLDVLATAPMASSQLFGGDQIAFNPTTNTVWVPTTDDAFTVVDALTLASLASVPHEETGPSVCTAVTKAGVWVNSTSIDGTTGWATRFDSTTQIGADMPALAVPSGCLQGTSSGEVYLAGPDQLVAVTADGSPAASFAVPHALIAGVAAGDIWALGNTSPITLTGLTSGVQLTIEDGPGEILDAAATASNVWLVDFDGILWVL